MQNTANLILEKGEENVISFPSLDSLTHSFSLILLLQRKRWYTGMSGHLHFISTGYVLCVCVVRLLLCSSVVVERRGNKAAAVSSNTKFQAEKENM